VKIVITQAVGSQLIQCWHLARAAKGAGLSEADVVEQNDDDVRCPLGALISKRGGALTLRASSSVIAGDCGSGTGSTVRLISCAINSNGSKPNVATSKYITGEFFRTISDFIVIGLVF
jgi:hypothetical protein